jgi:hypothetical protein
MFSLTSVSAHLQAIRPFPTPSRASCHAEGRGFESLQPLSQRHVDVSVQGPCVDPWSQRSTPRQQACPPHCAARRGSLTMGKCPRPELQPGSVQVPAPPELMLAPARSGPARPFLRQMLRWSACVELATGLALLAVPATVFDLLIGSASDSGTEAVARVLGAALFALGVAGWSAGATPERGLTLGFVIYNVITTGILVVGGLNGSADGSLLWPAAALHAIASAVLITGWGCASNRRPLTGGDPERLVLGSLSVRFQRRNRPIRGQNAETASQTAEGATTTTASPARRCSRRARRALNHGWIPRPEGTMTMSARDCWASSVKAARTDCPVRTLKTALVVPPMSGRAPSRSAPASSRTTPFQ